MAESRTRDIELIPQAVVFLLPRQTGPSESLSRRRSNWLAASGAFSTYLANFKSFNVTHGSFAAAIILLIWLWLTNVALLLGAEVNAELERAKEIAEGLLEPETLNLPPAH